MLTSFAIGGSSLLNSYVWVRPPAADIDAFEALGSPGWNWAEFEKYSKKAEWLVHKELMPTPIHCQVICSFHVPTKEQTDLYLDPYDLNFRGTSGPIQVTNPPHYHAADALLNEILVNKGLKATKDPHGGDVSLRRTG